MSLVEGGRSPVWWNCMEVKYLSLSARCQETRCQMLIAIELLCGSDFKNSLVGMKVRIALFGQTLT